MRYNRVQFLSYATETPLPSVADAALALEERCALIERAMTSARDALTGMAASESGEPTLKVFMAPEYFFGDATTPYAMDEVRRVVTRLQGVVGTAEWTDWVFCFGSIVGSSAPTIGGVARQAFNFALIQEGGVAAAGPAGARILARPITTSDASAQQVGTPGSHRRAYDGSGIFTMRDLMWSADISVGCGMDRSSRALQLPGETYVQIQLRLSRTAACAPDEVAGPGGLVLEAGENAGATRLRAVGGSDIAVSARVPVTGDDAGEIVLFDPQPIPAAAIVPGTRRSLLWRASEAYHFGFDLLYDELGRFSTVLVAPKRAPIDIFHGTSYFLPLAVADRDPHDHPVEIAMQLRNGSHGYDHALGCKVAVPGLEFEGEALLFASNVAGPPPRTAW